MSERTDIIQSSFDTTLLVGVCRGGQFSGQSQLTMNGLTNGDQTQLSRFKMFEDNLLLPSFLVES